MTDYTVDMGWCEDYANATSGDPNYADYFFGLRTTRRPTVADDVVRLEDLEETLFIGIPGSGTSIIDTPDLSEFSCGGGEGALLGIYEAVNASNNHYGLNYYALFTFDAGTGGIATDARVQPFVNPANAVDCTDGFWVAVGGRYEAGDKLLAQRLGVRVPGASLDSASLTVGAWRESGADNDRWIAFRRLNAYSGNAAPPKYAFIYNEDIVDPYGFFVIEVLDEEASPITTQERFVISDLRADVAYGGAASGWGGFGFNTKPAQGDLANGLLSYAGDAFWTTQNDDNAGSIQFKALGDTSTIWTSMGCGSSSHSTAPDWCWAGWTGADSNGVCLGGFGASVSAAGASLVIHNQSGTLPAHAIAFKGNALFFGSTDVTNALATMTAGGFAYDSGGFYFCDGASWTSITGGLAWVRDANGIYFNESGKNVALGTTPSANYKLYVYDVRTLTASTYYYSYVVSAYPTFTADGATSIYYMASSYNVRPTLTTAVGAYTYVYGQTMDVKYNGDGGFATTLPVLAAQNIIFGTTASANNITITNISGITISEFFRKGGTVALGTSYALRIVEDASATVVPTTRYGISQEGANLRNYFAGNVGIGILPVAVHPLTMYNTYNGVVRCEIQNPNTGGGSVQAEFRANAGSTRTIAIGCGGENATYAKWGYVLAGAGLTSGVGWGYVIGASTNFITYPSGLTQFNSAGVGIGTTGSPSATYTLNVDTTRVAVNGDAGIYHTYGATVTNSVAIMYGQRNQTQPVIQNTIGSLYGLTSTLTFNNNPSSAKTVSGASALYVGGLLGAGAGANLTITELTGILLVLSKDGSSTATVGTKRALWIGASSGFTGDVYAIYQAGASDYNHFAGKMGIYTTPNTFYGLRVGAGSSGSIYAAGAILCVTTIRANTGFNCNGSAGATGSGTNVTVVGGIVTAVS